MVSKRELCFVVILLMMFQAVASVWGVAHSHGGAATAEAEAARHGVLAPVADEHGHSHEDGEPDEWVPGHLHDHNPFDHSHETPSVTSDFSFASPNVFGDWVRGEIYLARTGAPEQIDRPPRHF